MPDELQKVREMFWYDAEFTSFTAGTSSTVSISIQADADFIIRKHTFDCRAGGNVTPYTTPSVTITLIDQGSGRQMSDIAVHIGNFFGTAQFPYILPQEKRISANSVFQVICTSLETVTSINLRLCFHGYKEYNYRPPGR